MLYKRIFSVHNFVIIIFYILCDHECEYECFSRRHKTEEERSKTIILNQQSSMLLYDAPRRTNKFVRMNFARDFSAFNGAFFLVKTKFIL